MADDILTLALDQVVLILHGRHREYSSRSLDVRDRDLAQPRMTDDALVQQLADGAELFVARHVWVDAVKLPEIDLVDAEPLETALGLRNQICRVPVGDPLVRTRTGETSLGGDQ